jgi:hypothetical protein
LPTSFAAFGDDDVVAVELRNGSLRIVQSDFHRLQLEGRSFRERRVRCNCLDFPARARGSGRDERPPSHEEEAPARSLLDLLQRDAPDPISSEATLAFTSTRYACTREPRASARSLRSRSMAADCSEMTTPSPPHVGHLRVRISRGPSVTFCRVISTRPSGEISTT